MCDPNESVPLVHGRILTDEPPREAVRTVRRKALDAAIARAKEAEALAAKPVLPRIRWAPFAHDIYPGWVYVLRCETTGWFKFGRSVQPVTRARAQMVGPTPPTFVGAIPSDDDDMGARRLEAQLHQRFASVRKNGEWFAVDASEVEALPITSRTLDALRREVAARKRVHRETGKRPARIGCASLRDAALAEGVPHAAGSTS